MSRYAFYDIVSNAKSFIDDNGEGLVDIKGYSMDCWLSYGTIGWDEPLSTYFIQLDRGEESIPWWIGDHPKAIPTFDALCDAINHIFNVPSGTFDFNATPLLSHETESATL